MAEGCFEGESIATSHGAVGVRMEGQCPCFWHSVHHFLGLTSLVSVAAALPITRPSKITTYVMPLVVPFRKVLDLSQFPFRHPPPRSKSQRLPLAPWPLLPASLPKGTSPQDPRLLRLVVCRFLNTFSLFCREVAASARNGSIVPRSRTRTGREVYHSADSDQLIGSYVVSPVVRC